ncbi:hypothetical protein [Nitrospira sp. M1]
MRVEYDVGPTPRSHIGDEAMATDVWITGILEYGRWRLLTTSQSHINDEAMATDVWITGILEYGRWR